MQGVRFQWQTIVRRTGLAGLWLTALLIAQKRWSGELTTDCSEAIVVGTAGAVGLLSVLVMLVIAPRESRPSRLLTRLWLTALPSFLAGLSLLPDASAAGPAGLSLGLMLAVLAPSLIGRPEDVRSIVTAAQTSSVAETASSVVKITTAQPRALTAGASSACVETAARLLEPSGLNDAEPCGLESAGESLRPLPSEQSSFHRFEEPPAGEPDVDELDEDRIDEADEECSLQIGPATRQWMTRTIRMHGEVVEGGCRIEFSVGQKQAVLHLPFTPALSGTPEFECEALDGSDVRFRITARLPYGIRMEISRSSGLDQCQSVELGYSASAPLQRQSAAA